jgi:transposase
VKDSVLSSLLDRASDAKKRYIETEKKLMAEFKDDRTAQLLMTIPGVGIKTAAFVSSMIVDISRFPDADHLAAYFGVVPKKRESADSDPRCGITRRGDERARKLLYQATTVHIAFCEDSSIKDLFERVAGKRTASGTRSNYKKGVTAATRKMLTIMYVMIVTDSEFRNRV